MWTAFKRTENGQKHSHLDFNSANLIGGQTERNCVCLCENAKLCNCTGESAMNRLLIVTNDFWFLTRKV